MFIQEDLNKGRRTQTLAWKLKQTKVLTDGEMKLTQLVKRVADIFPLFKKEAENRNGWKILLLENIFKKTKTAVRVLNT